MGHIIQTVDLTKQFHSLKAVDSLSIGVNQGEIYGFLGLNGAGKTTTIRMLLGMISPTFGSAVLQGQKVSPGNLSLWKKVGYLVEIPYAYPELTTRQNLGVICRLRDLPEKAIEDVILKLHLKRYEDTLAKNLSLGNAQRLGLAKAIMHKPEILILDEPANGLDPVGIVEIRNLLLDLAHNHGVTVFISSHILGEIAKIASRIGIIHNGKLIQELSIHEVERYRQQWLHIGLQKWNEAIPLLEGKGLTVSRSEDGDLKVFGEDAILHPEKINTFLVNSGFEPFTLKVEQEDLEAYFLRMIDQNGGIQ